MYYNKIEKRERAVIVGVVHDEQKRWMVDDYLNELELLAETAGADVVDRIIQEREKLDPAYMIGRGKVKELALLSKYQDADIIIFDDDLTPAQVKNIEDHCNVKILDRSGLILDIFAKHARTHEARIQVELAQLRYLSTRLTRQWTHLSRQVGGIGVRGPGETQLETDRRLIRKRIAVLTKEMEKVANQRQIRRKPRKNIFKAALVGYTNVGKSTLLNTLTQSDVKVENQLFATLDATVRSLQVEDHRRILAIDTVGFIRKLPHHLVASFKSTLEEAREADLLLHVIDVSHPNYIAQKKTVESVLSELHFGTLPVLKVFNKIDKVDDPHIISHIKKTEQPCVCISASKGIFIKELLDKIKQYADRAIKHLKVTLPVQDSGLIARLYSYADVLNVEYSDGIAQIDLNVSLLNAEQVFKLLQKSEPIIEETDHENTRHR